MKKLFYLAVFFFVANASAQTVNSQWRDGVVYYKLSANADLQENPKKAKSVFGKKYQVIDIVQSFSSAKDDDLQRIFRIDFENIENIDALLEELRNNPDIEYAEPAPLIQTCTPNDPYYNVTLTNGKSSSWHLNLINAADAWNITTGNENIKVAIVDNAIWTEDHPDLKNKIVMQRDVADGDDDANPPSSANTNWSHGTHCAGLAAAETNNNTGIASIGNGISIIAVKTTKNNSTNPRNLDAVFEGIVWAANNGADVISMSFSTNNFSQTMQNIIDYAYNKGCVLVAAAGNDGGNANQQIPQTPNYPAALNHVISVGSCNSNNAKSSFSNYGAWIDVMAPGDSLLSTVNYIPGSPPHGVSDHYNTLSGTSMACPVVAGLCGLMLSANPNLTPEKITAILKKTCVNINAQNPMYIGKIGAGRINAFAAVQASFDSISPVTANFRANRTVARANEPIIFTDLSSGSPTSWLWEFEGGSPSQSEDPNPTVYYLQSGVFQVKLTVSNGTDTNTEIKTDFITIPCQGISGWETQSTNILAIDRGILYTDIVDENTAWVLTLDGLETGEGTNDFARTTDGGNTWLAGVINIPSNYTPAGISAIDGATAYLVAFGTNPGGGIFKTTDGGQTWIHQTTATFGNISSFGNVIHFFNENEGVVQGDPVNGKFEIYTTGNGGNTWELNTNSPAILSGEAGWTGCIAAYNDNVWFGTNKGRVFRSTDKGHTWEAFPTGAIDIAPTISFADALNGVAICNRSGSDYKLLRTEDGGKTWSKINITDGYLSDISAVPNTAGVLVGIKKSNSCVSHSSAYSLDNGNTWTTIDNAVQYTNIKMYSQNIGYAGGFCNGEPNGGGIYAWKLPAGFPTENNLAEKQSKSIKIYPNPAENIVYIENAGNARYEIFDIMGKIVVQGNLSHSAQVNIGHLAKGYYFVKIYENNIFTNKIIKK